MKARPLLGAVVVSGLLAACGGDDSPAPPPTGGPPAASTISFNAYFVDVFNRTGEAPGPTQPYPVDVYLPTSATSGQATFSYDDDNEATFASLLPP